MGNKTLSLFILCMCTHGMNSDVYDGYGQSYTAVPIASILSYPGTVTEIDLEKNTITSLNANDFSSFTDTTIIQLALNQMTTVDDAAFCGTPLVELHLDRNPLGFVPILSCVGATLDSLYLESCGICSITTGTFDGMTALTSLFIQDNCLNSLEGFAPLKPTIEYLSLSSNAFTTVDTHLQNFLSMNVLSLTDNSISSFHTDACLGSSINFLDLSGNQLTEIPNVSHLGSTMTRLYLSRNYIGDNIDATNLANLTFLYHLLLSDNQVTEFPYSLCTEDVVFRQAIRRIGLDDNLITEIPDPIGCNKLRSLELNRNPLTSIPSLGDSFTHLHTIYLTGIQETSVPEDNVGYLNGLSSLYLDNCNIQSWSTLSEILNHTYNLETLILNNNMMKDLGPEIYQVPTLTRLELENNSIACLPEPPSDFTPTLTTLILRKNPLQCDCCNEWLYAYSGTVNILVDEAPCNWPPPFVGVPWNTVVSRILSEGCLYTTESPTTDPPTTDPPTTDPPTTDPPTTDPLTSDPPTTDPPTTDPPTTDPPTTDPPTTDPPTTDPPTTDSLTTEPPTTDPPTTDPPTTDPPTTDPPTTDPPTTDPPITDLPTTDPPTTDPPTTDLPTTDPPTTDPPTTDPPTTDPPTTDPPTTDPPTTDLPTTDPPATDLPTTDLPTIDLPTTDLPTTDPPTTDLPTTDLPTTNPPTTDTPTTDIPTTDPPTTDPTTTDPPTTDPPTTDPPTTDPPTTGQHITSSTTISAPISEIPLEMTSPHVTFTLEWNNWMPWTDCTTACGGGLQLRWMLCDSSETCESDGIMYPLNGSDFIYTVQARACVNNPCPIDGYWLSWRQWGSCSATCGLGLRTRKKICQEPQHGGLTCTGKDITHESCQVEECSEEEERKRLEELTAQPVYTESDNYPTNKSIGIFAIAFSGTIFIVLMIIDVPAFKRDLVRLYENLTGKEQRHKLKTEGNAKIKSKKPLQKHKDL